MSPRPRLTAGLSATGLLLSLVWSPGPAAQERRESPPKRASREELQQWVAGAPERAAVGRVASRLTASLGPPAGLVWGHLGPKPITSEYWSGNADAAGRVSALLVHPVDPSVVYLAAAQGGVWKSTDAGASWTPLTDGLSSLASGALAFDPDDPNTIYYATGEQHQSADSYFGDGLFRSTDAGATWSKIAPRTSSGSYVARVAVDPVDPSRLYLASSRGFVRSLDGGVNWTVTLAGDWCSDLAIDPVNSNVVYASIFTHGIYKSIDYGATWTLLGGGLPAAGFDRINLAIAPSDGQVLYASFVDNAGALEGMYRTADGGTSWSPLVATPNYLATQGWYDNFVAVDPTDADVCYAGGVFPYTSGYHGVIKTTDGGASWSDITFGVDGGQVHPDQHFMTFGPDGTLWLANDGGVWKSPDGGDHWVNCNATLALTQFYSLALHPTDPAQILGGTQDNGTLIYQGTIDWPELVAGDGGPCAFEWDSPNIFYSTYVYLTSMLQWNAGSFNGDVTGPWDAAGDRASWCDGPLITDPNQPNTLLAGTYRVWRSVDSGASWGTISGDLPGGNAVLLGLAVASGNSNIIYASTSNGLVHVTSDGGAVWSPRSAGLPAVALHDIVLDPSDPLRAYTCAKLNNGSRVFRTLDAGLSWTSLTGDLPAGPRPLALAVDFRTAPPRLYLGTDFGLYASIDEGVDWELSSGGLPTMAIDDLAVDPLNNFLVAATYGRGMYRAALDVTAPVVSVTAPNGAEAWEMGSTQTVTWDASDLNGVDAVSLLLSTDGGASYPTTIVAGISNSGTYAWALPNAASPACRVKVVAVDAWSNSADDVSDADFHIYDPATVSAENRARLGFALRPVAPNPIRLPAVVEFQLPRAAGVLLDVFDLAGRHVRQIASGTWPAGRHTVSWDGRDQAGILMHDGIYYCRLRAGGFQAIRRMMLVR